ncbi:hypothetical protein G7Y89_g14450 [Cudoniella acicularis]|uniref:Uncharacterized protein n=1 Tax=Cudoniella acicularis TaxID=354080 RepID=A0A8H4R4A5_9HELO|nr:hypothetical protein G7Y89_g14450 [Cudoniella acicularis]
MARKSDHHGATIANPANSTLNSLCNLLSSAANLPPSNMFAAVDIAFTQPLRGVQGPNASQYRSTCTVSAATSRSESPRARNQGPEQIYSEGLSAGIGHRQRREVPGVGLDGGPPDNPHNVTTTNIWKVSTNLFPSTISVLWFIDPHEFKALGTNIRDTITKIRNLTAGRHRGSLIAEGRAPPA